MKTQNNLLFDLFMQKLIRKRIINIKLRLDTKTLKM